jgi:hypothetical protein
MDGLRLHNVAAEPAILQGKKGLRLTLRGDRARLYVHDQEQPTLIVNDVKSGRHAKGAVALWVGPGTVAHFRNLRVGSLPTN